MTEAENPNHSHPLEEQWPPYYSENVGSTDDFEQYWESVNGEGNVKGASEPSTPEDISDILENSPTLTPHVQETSNPEPDPTLENPQNSPYIPPELLSEPYFSVSPEEQQNLEQILAENPAIQDADWFGLAKKLRQRNRDLLQKVATLEQALDHSTQELERKRQNARRTASHNDSIGDSAEENSDLQAAQAQIALLFEELEASHQVAQRQQGLIETLTGQLEAAQTHIIQLEQECALVHQRYQEHKQLLVQASDNSQELRDRLSLQHHHTQQFKEIIEKYMVAKQDATQPGIAKPEIAKPGIAKPEMRSPQSSPKLQKPSPPKKQKPDPIHFSNSTKPQPIQPWSIQFRNEQSGVGEPPGWVTRLVNHPQDNPSEGYNQDIHEPEISMASEPSPSEPPKETASPESYSFPDPSTPDLTQTPPSGKYKNISLPTFSQGASTSSISTKVVKQVAKPVSIQPDKVHSTPGVHPPEPKPQKSLAGLDLPTFPRYRRA